uniref:non-specific serine/threonine protein kinase n=1 Tax=Romanomermis culicivorax TaxID=13658 RepID=A0A915KCC0_ROMCU
MGVPSNELDNPQNFGERSGSTISLNKLDRQITSYEKVVELLSHDATYQKDVSLGKRIGFYKLGKELGSGNFSKVKLGLHVLTKEKVAVKIMDKSKMDQKSQKLLQREIENMDVMHHPNIVRLFELVETFSKIYLSMEFAGGGELYHYVIQNNCLPEDEAKRLFAQVLSAVIHMHENGIIHRDIKAENVFFAAPNWVKLGDFGFSTEITPGEMLNTFCGSPPYAAPELFKDKSYQGDFVDIWALGILLYFMVVGNTPFRGESVAELKKQILNGYFTFPETASPFFQDLVNGILKQDPITRYSLIDVQNHYWLSKEHFPVEFEKYSLTPSEQELAEKEDVRAIWTTLHSLGISAEMMTEASSKGVRSAIVGTYRIILCQVQSKDEQMKKDLLAKNMAQKLEEEKNLQQQNGVSLKRKQLMKRTSKLCTIL